MNTSIITHVAQQPSLIVALNRLVAAGTLKRLAKGKYYKPKQSILGELPPETFQKVKEYLIKDNQVIGYITGTNAFAYLGLTIFCSLLFLFLND